MEAELGPDFDLLPTALFEQGIPALEVRTRDGSSLDFERGPTGQPGHRLLDLLAVTRRAVRAGHLVLLPGLRVHKAGQISDDMPHTFVWSLGGCAGMLLAAAGEPGTPFVVPRDALEYQIPDLLRYLADNKLVPRPGDARRDAAALAYRTSGHRLLLGDRAALRLAVSYLEPAPPPQAIIDPLPVCLDYRGLSHLWADDDQLMGDQDADGFRWLRMIAIGSALGEAHSRGVLHGDTNKGNFVVDEARMSVTWLDLAGSRTLYGPAPTAECATDLLPLMHDCDGRDWYNVRRGYLRSWPDGDRVFDLIESRDWSGWMQAFRRKDYRLALDRLAEALRLVEQDDAAQVAHLADRRAWCHQLLGEHDAAVRAHHEAITLADEHQLPGFGWYYLNLALLYRNTGQLDLARSVLMDFLAHGHHPGGEQPAEYARTLLAKLRGEDQP
jgi:tetratricopeptide (TPR) repeat protein